MEIVKYILALLDNWNRETNRFAFLLYFDWFWPMIRMQSTSPKPINNFDADTGLFSEKFPQISNIKSTLLGNIMFDNSDVDGKSLVGAASTTSSFSA